MAEISSSSSSSGMAATVAVGGGDCGTSPSALKKTKVWRVCIDMDSAIKRPYSPSIEVVTRPGEVLDDGRKREETEGKDGPPEQEDGGDETVAKRAKDCETEILSPADGVEEKKKEKLVQRAASSVAVILRSWSKVEFAVFGLRLPPGVDRQDLQCFWRARDQHAVIWAPCTDETPSAEGGLLTGVSMDYGGFLACGAKPHGGNPLMMGCLLYDSKSSSLYASNPNREDSMQTLFTPAGGGNVRWEHIIVLPKARVFPYEVLETEVANALKQTEESDQTPPEDAYDGDGGYEFQYWFRRPVIRVIHYDEKFSGGGFGSPPDPYEPNPLGVDKNDDVKQQQKEDSGAEDDGGEDSENEAEDGGSDGGDDGSAKESTDNEDEAEESTKEVDDADAEQ